MVNLFQQLGQKVGKWFQSKGSKTLRGVQSLGNKVLDVPEKVLDVADKIPIVRDIPVVGAARQVVGLARRGVNLAGHTADFIDRPSWGGVGRIGSELVGGYGDAKRAKASYEKKSKH